MPFSELEFNAHSESGSGLSARPFAWFISTVCMSKFKNDCSGSASLRKGYLFEYEILGGVKPTTLRAIVSALPLEHGLLASKR